MTVRHQGRWIHGVQIFVTVGLVILLLTQVEWSNLPGWLPRLRWDLVAEAFSVLLASHIVSVLRWHLLLHHPSISYLALLPIYGAGLFGANLLPTGFGGDGIRAFLLSRRIPWRRATLSVGLDRAIGLIALSALLGIGLRLGIPTGIEFGWSGPLGLDSHWWLLSTALGLAAVLCAIFLLIQRGQPRIRDAFHRVLWGCRNGIQAVTSASKHWLGYLTGGYVLSVVSHLCMVGANWLVLEAAGIGVEGGAAVWLVLIASLSLLLPISINGLGVQEAAYVAVLGLYDTPATPAILAAFLNRLLVVLFAVLGGLLWLWFARCKRARGRS